MSQFYVSNHDIDEWFRYHPFTDAQVDRSQKIRDAAIVLAREIRDNIASCPDQSVAFRKLRECVMTANAAIALEKKR